MVKFHLLYFDSQQEVATIKGQTTLLLHYCTTRWTHFWMR